MTASAGTSSLKGTRSIDKPETLRGIALITTHSQFLATFEDYQVMAVEPAVDFLNASYVHECRAVMRTKSLGFSFCPRLVNVSRSS